MNITWNQMPNSNCGIIKKLDIVMGNVILIETFPSIFASFHPYRLSDHCPVIINVPLKVEFKVLPFKFPNVIAQNLDFKLLVENVGIWISGGLRCLC